MAWKREASPELKMPRADVANAHEEWRRQDAAIRVFYMAAVDLADAEYAQDGPFKPRYAPDGLALSGRPQEYADQHPLSSSAPTSPSPTTRS
jgi:hypothetical protein